MTPDARRTSLPAATEIERAESLGRPVRVCPNCQTVGAMHYEADRIENDRMIRGAYSCTAAQGGPA